MAPRPNARKRCGRNSTEKILALTCRWQGCNDNFELHLDEYQTFAEHVMQHIKQYLDATNRNEGVMSFSYKCSWNNCSWEVQGNPDEFTRHTMFHAYHSKLKCLGAFEMILDNANQCTLDVETQDLLPEVTEPFLCKWDSCGLNLLCPEKFYKHVDMHAYSAGREDVMVVAEEKGKLYSLPNSGEMVNGMPVQKILQSVCRWEGCSFLGRSAAKVKDHCRTHTGERQLSCPNCGGFFSNKTKFIDHLTRQNAKLYEKFQCSHCLRRCASERLLRDHMRHHVNHVKCPHCDMTCANPSSLRGHIKFRHTIDCPFSCSMCSYRCKTANDLKRHEETHFGNRFQCEVENCDYLARTLAGMRSHMKLVHEQKRCKEKFQCHICQKKFSRGYFLTVHLKSDHAFSWPTGHMRFQYRKHEDGFIRLQMVRFESAELSEMLTEDNEQVQQMDTNWINNETGLPSTSIESSPSMVGIQSDATSSMALERSIDGSNLDTLYGSQESTTFVDVTSSVSTSVETPIGVNLCDSYVEVLNYYEAVNANEKDLAMDNVLLHDQPQEVAGRSLLKCGMNTHNDPTCDKSASTSCIMSEELLADANQVGLKSLSETVLSSVLDGANKLQTTLNIVDGDFSTAGGNDVGQIECIQKPMKLKLEMEAMANLNAENLNNEECNMSVKQGIREGQKSNPSKKSLDEKEFDSGKVCEEIFDISRELREKRVDNIKAKRNRNKQESKQETCSEKSNFQNQKSGRSSRTQQKRNHSALNGTNQSKRKRLPRAKNTGESVKLKRIKTENQKTNESEISNDYEQVILDVSRTLLSLHNSDNKDELLNGIPF